MKAKKHYRLGPRSDNRTKRTPEERRELHLANSRRNMPKANERRRAKKLALLKEKAAKLEEEDVC